MLTTRSLLMQRQRRAGAQQPAAAPPRPRRVAAAASAADGAPSSATAPPPRRRRPLQPSDFQHPLDEQNTRLLRSLPGLEAAARVILTSPVVEQALVVDNLASAVKVGPKQLSTVHGLLQDAARALDLEGPIPDVYVRQSPVPNAYTLAVGGLSPSSSPLSTFWADRRPFVVVHTSLLDLLTQDELKAVLAHELAHLKCNHGLYLASANALASGASGLLGPLVAPALESALLRWLRAAELTCDRGALLATGCPRVVVGALMKLAGGSNTYARELSVDAFLEQARQYQDAVSDGFGRAIGASQSRALTHPHPVVRAKEIDRWAGSAQYRRLAAEVEAGGDGGAAASAAWSASR